MSLSCRIFLFQGTRIDDGGAGDFRCYCRSSAQEYVAAFPMARCNMMLHGAADLSVFHHECELINAVFFLISVFDLGPNNPPKPNSLYTNSISLERLSGSPFMLQNHLYFVPLEIFSVELKNSQTCVSGRSSYAARSICEITSNTTSD